jgi:hypothetical protein
VFLILGNDDKLTSATAESRLRTFGRDGRQLCRRLPVASDHQTLTGHELLDQLGQMGLRFFDANWGHTRRPDLAALSQD